MDKPSKEELLASISPDMRLTKIFFKRTYGYEISFPGFSEQAVAALEAAGCARAREYYDTWVREYETARAAEMKEVGKWYLKECERQWERQQKNLMKERGDQIRGWNLQDLTENELTELCERLLADGVIESPEQFVMAVLHGQ